MSEPLYQAHPSIWRSHPIGVLLVWLVLLLGAWISLTGQVPWFSALLSELPLPAGFSLRWIGYGLVAGAGLPILVWWIGSLSDRLEIHPNEVIWTHGLLSRTYTEINMGSIRTVRVHQSLLQRILGAGDLVILTAGDIPELSVRGLPRPREIRDHIKQRSGAV